MQCSAGWTDGPTAAGHLQLVTRQHHFVHFHALNYIQLHLAPDTIIVVTFALDARQHRFVQYHGLKFVELGLAHAVATFELDIHQHHCIHYMEVHLPTAHATQIVATLACSPKINCSHCLLH